MLPYRQGIRDVIARINSFMISSHSRIAVVRFDVRYPDGHEGPTTNEHMSQLMKSITRWFAFRGIDMRYVWVREQNLSRCPHYHLVLWIDGRVMQNTYEVWLHMTTAWGQIVGGCGEGLVHGCPMPTGYFVEMLRRPKVSAVLAEQSAFCSQVGALLAHLDYLAKAHTKGLAPHRVRDFGSSEISEDWEMPGWFSGQAPAYPPV